MTQLLSYNGNLLPKDLASFIYLPIDTPVAKLALSNSVQKDSSVMGWFVKRPVNDNVIDNFLEGQKTIATIDLGQSVPYTNYTQLFAKATDESSTVIGSLNGQKNTDQLAAEAMQAFMFDVEGAFVSGVKDAGSATTARKTDGLHTVINTNIVDASGGLSKTNINDAVKKVVKKLQRKLVAGDQFTILCNIDPFFAITELYKTEVPSRTDGGANIVNIITPVGTVTVELCLSLPANEILFISKSEISCGYIPTFGSVIRENQIGEQGFYSGTEFKAELGLVYGDVEKHAKMINVLAIG